MTLISSRRSFLLGLGAALITAPAIVRAGSLMPVRQMQVISDGVALTSIAHPVMVPVITGINGPMNWGGRGMSSEWIDINRLQLAGPLDHIYGVVTQYAQGESGARFFTGDVISIKETS